MDKIYQCRLTTKNEPGRAPRIEPEYTVNGKPLDPRLDLVNHSPTGFAHGYAGSGPAQLALAILADYTGDDQLAEHLHQRFKFDMIAPLPQDREWSISGSEIRKWLARQVPDEARGITEDVAAIEYGPYIATLIRKLENGEI